jgi:hypothetical protein
VSLNRFPQLLGGLALVWAGRAWIWTPPGWLSVEVFLTVTLAYTVAGVWLLRGRHVPVGAALLVGASLGQFIGQPDVTNSPVALLFWASVIVCVSEGRPHERALLLRVCVTCVYAFAALTKMNPAVLAGDGMVRIAMTRPHWQWALELLSGPVGVTLAWVTILVELWLAVGLWFRQTRLATAALGVGLHVLLLPVAATSWGSGLAFLFVLNFGLVAMYPAFWTSIRPVRAATRYHAAVPVGS